MPFGADPVLERDVHGEPLSCKTVERASEKGYWRSDGKILAAATCAAIVGEIQKKGHEVRFLKMERSVFALAK